MSINILKQPSELSLSKNPIEYKFETDNFITNQGGKAFLKLELSITGSSTTFTLSWQNVNIRFTGVLTPDDSGTQYQYYFTGTLSDWADKVKLYLERNYKLFNDFDLARDSSGGEFITFTAKKEGTDFTLTFTVISGTDIFLDTNNPGIDKTFNQNYKILNQIFIEDINNSNNFKEKAELRLIPDENNIAIFDIHSILHTSLQKDLPAYNQQNITKAQKIIKRYFIRFGEISGSIPGTREILTTNISYVLMGGTDFKFFNENPDFLNDNLIPQKAFLTWQPDDKKINEKQQEYLYFPITSINTTTIKSKTDIFYTDGSSDLNVLIETITPVNKFEIYIIPVGFDPVISGVANGIKTVDYFTIYIVDQSDTIISQQKTYFLNRKIYFETEYLLYKNSLGAFETLRVTGEVVKTMDITKNIFRTILPPDFLITDPEFSETNISSKDSMKLSTGFITKAELQHLQEFILSDSRFIDKENNFIPVILNTKKLDFFKTSNNLYAMSFEIQTAINSAGFSLKNYKNIVDLFIEDFESGDFSNWSVINGSETNAWFVGQAERSDGDFGAYISNDGGVNAAYTNNSQSVTHFYKDITIPENAIAITLFFNWKCIGENSSGQDRWDYGRVFIKETTFIPTAGTQINFNDHIGKTKYNNQRIFISERIDIDPSIAGTTKRLIFSWRNDVSSGEDPPFCIDNIKLRYKTI